MRRTLPAVIVITVALSACGGSRGTQVARTVRVSYDGVSCAPSWNPLAAGTYEFSLQDRGSETMSLRLVNAADDTAASAARSVDPGGAATVRAVLSPGVSYAWRCQMGNQPLAISTSIHVPERGKPVPSSAPAGIATANLFQPLVHYTAYAHRRLTKVRSQLASLDSKLAAGDWAGAKSAWLAAHVSWLAIGQDDGAYGAFGNLGNQIDGTAGGDVGTTSSRDFTGFHRVELDIWHSHDLRAARHDAAVLSRLVGSINPDLLNKDLPPTTVGLDAWVLRCHEILEDALRDTLGGTDDYGSHTGLASVGADVTATREMLRVLGALIEPRAPGLVRKARAQLNAIDAVLVAAHPAGSVWIAPASLPVRMRDRLDGAVDAALNTLAPVSELMQISGANS